MGSPYMRLRTLDGHIHAPHDGATPLAVSSPPFPQPHPSSPATPLTSAWALRQGGGPAAAPAAYRRYCAGGAGQSMTISGASSAAAPPFAVAIV